MNFLELCKKRYTVRKFSSRRVEQEKLDLMLEAGNTAPTAKNQQPHKIYVLQSEQALAKIDELTACRYGAPIVLLFTYDETKEWKNPFEPAIHSGVEDVSIVATHIMLQATELEVGTAWINLFANSKIEKAFDLPTNEHAVLLMCVGYKAKDAEPFPNHTNKKSLDEIVKYI